MPGAQDQIRAQLLHSIAEVACTLVSGRAASVGLLDDDELVFVATAGIAADEVEVQVKGDRFRARARTATPEEKPELWRTMTATWPDYDDYQAKTDREIPVVVLERR